MGVSVSVVRDRAGVAELLFLRRSGGRFDGQWWPVTGTREGGEPPAACALRELEEETGLRPKALYATEIRAAVEGDRGHLRVFVAAVDAGAAVRLNWEHDDHRWLRVEEAESMTPPFTWATLRESIRIFRLAPAEQRVGPVNDAVGGKDEEEESA